MIKFLLKKSFFEAWDNLFKIILSNMVAVVVMGGLSLIVRIEILPIETVFYILFTVAILLLHIYAGAVSAAAAEVSDFKFFRLKTILDAIRETWIRSLSIGLISTVLFYIDIRVFAAALSSAGVSGYFPAGIVFWINIIWLSALQYIFPFLSMSGATLSKTLYKSFLVVFDNPGKTFFVLVFSLFLGVLSVFTLFLIPGLTCILLLHQNLLRILLRKYDWIEEDPQHNRKNVPWELLLKEDSDTVGHRSLKGLIFPWKD